MGKDKKGRGSPRRPGDKRKREPSPPLEDFVTLSTRRRRFPPGPRGRRSTLPPTASFDDLDDSQGIAAEVWTYIQSVERTGLEGSDESEVSSDEENSSDSSEEGSGSDDDDEGDSSGDDSGGGGGGNDGGKGGGGGSGDGRSDDGSKASGKAPLA
jgi:hypothetical protein